MHLDIIVGGRYMEIKSKADMMESSYHKYRKCEEGLDNLGNEISIAKEAISHNDINLSNQIQSKEHVKV